MGDGTDVVAGSELGGLFADFFDVFAALEDFADALGKGVGVGVVYGGGVTFKLGVLDEEGPGGGVDEDGASGREVFGQFGGVAGEGAFFGLTVEGEDGGEDVGAGLEGDDFFLGEGEDFDAGEVEPSTEEFVFGCGGAEDEFGLEGGGFVEGAGDAQEAFFLPDNDAGVDDTVGGLAAGDGEFFDFFPAFFEFEGVGEEGGGEAEAALEVCGVAFGDDEAVFGGAEDFGLEVVDEPAFEGGDGGAADGDVHVVGIKGEPGLAVCEVGADEAGPVWVDGKDAVRLVFADGFDYETPENGDQGEAEVAFPAPDVGDLGKYPAGEGGFVSGNAWGDGGAWAACREGLVLCDDGEGGGVELVGEVAQDGGSSADVGRVIGRGDDDFVVLGGSGHVSWYCYIMRIEKNGMEWRESLAGCSLLLGFLFIRDSILF